MSAPGTGAWDAALVPERGLTSDELASVADVLDAALAWRDGALPWQEAARLGIVPWKGRPSPEYTRFLAVRTTPTGDPRRRALIGLCTHLDAVQGGVHTRHGRFGQGELDRLHWELSDLLDRGAVWQGVR